MKTLTITLIVASLAAIASAQQATTSQAIDNISRSAVEQLEESTKELGALRDQIAKEKQPLAEELTNLEQKLTQLRKDHENVTRKVDTGALDLTNLKAEMKARQDELAYVGNLLDEYARTFDTKINISEMQYCGDAVEAAKQAMANTTLSMQEKFSRQLAFVAISMKRLFDVVGGMRFDGIAVDMKGAVLKGKFALIGPVALFSAKGGASGIALPQAGSSNPLIRPLEGKIQEGIAALVESGEGIMPFDPSRGGALKALVQKTNIIHLFQKGGPIMWPLLLASILSLGTVLERVIFLLVEKARLNVKALEELMAAVAKGDIEGAIKGSSKSKYYVVLAMRYALMHREKSLASALEYSQAKELKRFRRGIPILDTVITLAPLLGLMGTVTGMMGSFSMLGGELSSPGAITGGIAEALIATAFGLGIAITSVIPFNFLNNRSEEARHTMESAAAQLELLLHPNGKASTTLVAHAIGSYVPRQTSMVAAAKAVEVEIAACGAKE